MHKFLLSGFALFLSFATTGCSIKHKHEHKFQSVDVGPNLSAFIDEVSSGVTSGKEKVIALSNSIKEKIGLNPDPSVDGLEHLSSSQSESYSVYLTKDSYGDVVVRLIDDPTQELLLDLDQLLLSTDSGDFAMIRDQSSDDSFHWWFHDQGDYLELQLSPNTNTRRIEGVLNFYFFN